MFFASDNTGPAHPAILQSMLGVDEGYAMPYGKSEPDQAVEDQLRDVLEAPDAAIYFAATGTGANSLLLATLCQPFQTVFCSSLAHIHADECAAPEFFSGGARLTTIPEVDAKLTPEGLERAISLTGNSIHEVQHGAVSITQATERGTLYSVDEVRAIADIAHARGMAVHMDGARIANAVAALGCSAADLTWRAGVDALSFGGTKNGCPCVEVMVLFDPEKAWELELRRKRGGHLFSKHRYMSAQLSAYLQGDLWLELAGKANAACANLARGLKQTPGVELAHEPQANMLFAHLPWEMHQRLRAAGANYYTSGAAPVEGQPVAVRMVCDWSASEENTQEFLRIAGGD